MNELKKRRAAGESGFTLIELLVVIAILAVLAGVVVFSLGGLTDDSQDSACEIDERTVRTAAEAYRSQNPAYPGTEQAMVDAGLLAELSEYTAYSLDAGVPQYDPQGDCVTP